MRRLLPLLLTLITACEFRTAESGRPPGTTSDADSLLASEQDSSVKAEVEATLREYYQRVSARDWRAVRASFWPHGTVTTRWTPPGERHERVSVQSVDEFVRRAPFGTSRTALVSERMVHAHVTGYGDMAEAWVIYEGRWGRGRDSARTTRGVDAFHLYRDNGEWRIVGLTNIGERRGRPLIAPRRPAARATPSRSSRRSAP